MKRERIVYYCCPDLIFKKYGLADVMWGRAGVAHNYPKQKFSETEKIYDTESIQNLLWSICSGTMVVTSLISESH
jgi:hypothetical protein